MTITDNFKYSFDAPNTLRLGRRYGDCVGVRFGIACRVCHPAWDHASQRHHARLALLTPGE